MTYCKSCGGFVTDDYARVFGDNENDVHDCRNCPSSTAESGDETEEETRTVLLRDIRTDGRGTTAAHASTNERDDGTGGDDGGNLAGVLSAFRS